MATTRKTITLAQLEALRTEAAEAGDMIQHSICTRAISGSQRATVECVRAIRGAEGQR